jgi:hypothetical protein
VIGVRTVVDTGSFHDVGVPALGVCKLVVLVLCVAELLTAAVLELYTEDICLPGRAVMPRSYCFDLPLLLLFGQPSFCWLLLFDLLTLLIPIGLPPLS